MVRQTMLACALALYALACGVDTKGDGADSVVDPTDGGESSDTATSADRSKACDPDQCAGCNDAYQNSCCKADGTCGCALRYAMPASCE